MASILWGTTGTAATFAPNAGPLAIGAAALGIGGILQAAIALPALRAARSQLRDQRGLVAAGAVAVFIYPLAFYSSMHLAGVAIGAVMSLASAPLASGVLERIIDRRPLSTWWMFASALGVLGAVLLLASQRSEPLASTTHLVFGIALGLIAGGTYATYSWVAHRLMSSGVSRAGAMGAVFGLGGALLIPVLLATGAPLIQSADAFLVAGYMALIPMFVGYVLFGFGLARVTASMATTITLTEPAVATILAVAIVGERLSPMGWVGLAAFGVVLFVLAVAPTNTAPAAPHLAA